MSRGQGWLRLTSFAPAQGSPAKLTVSVEADLLDGHRPPKDVRLLARREAKITVHRPTASDLERIAGSRLNRRSQVFHWRVSFQVPAEVGEDPCVSFELVAECDAALALPALLGQPFDLQTNDERSASRIDGCLTFAAALLAGLAPISSFRLGPEPLPPLELPPLGWETREPRPIYERATPRVGLFLAGAAALLAGLAPGFALADGSPSSASTNTTTPPAITQSGSTGTDTDPAPTTTTTSASTQTTTSQTTTETSTQTTTTHTTTTQTTTTQTSTQTTTTQTTTTPTSTKPGKPGRGVHHPKKHPTTHHRAGHPTKHSRHSKPSHHATHTRGASRAPKHRHPVPKPGSTAANTAPLVSTGTSFSAPVLTSLLTPAQLRTYSILVGGMVEPPNFLQRIYRAAGKHYGMPWQLLAAINYVETRYGKDLAVSPAGAIGWMQFMPATWSEYGESVNLKGKPAPGLPNPWDPTDAIFAAARYLKAAGAGRNLPQAVFAYNHAGWYVQEVLSIAEEINRHNMWPQRHASRKIAAMRTMARLLNGLPYVWGGGHSNFAMVQAGYDCSGFVSAVLHAGGYLDGPNTTQTLPGQPLILPGRGRYVTIRDRTYLSADQDHVIIDIDGQWWESGGWGVQSDRVHRMHNVTRAYLDSFNLILHPRGL